MSFMLSASGQEWIKTVLAFDGDVKSFVARYMQPSLLRSARPYTLDPHSENHLMPAGGKWGNAGFCFGGGVFSGRDGITFHASEFPENPVFVSLSEILEDVPADSPLHLSLEQLENIRRRVIRAGKPAWPELDEVIEKLGSEREPMKTAEERAAKRRTLVAAVETILREQHGLRSETEQLWNTKPIEVFPCNCPLCGKPGANWDRNASDPNDAPSLRHKKCRSKDAKRGYLRISYRDLAPKIGIEWDEASATVAPTEIVLAPGDIEQHATQIELHQAAARRSAAESVVAIGKELAAAQAKLANHGNGAFCEWIKHRLGMSKSSAFRAIAAYQAFKDCPTLGQFEATALYALASGKTLEEATSEALSLAAAGEVVTAEKAREIIKKHSEPTEPTPPAPFEYLDAVDELRSAMRRQFDKWPEDNHKDFSALLRGIADFIDQSGDFVS